MSHLLQTLALLAVPCLVLLTLRGVITRQNHRLNTATHSTWWVSGNASNTRSPSTV